MGVLESVLLAVHVVVALVVIGLVLLQHGKGSGPNEPRSLRKALN